MDASDRPDDMPIDDARIEKAALSLAGCASWADLPLPGPFGDHVRYVPAMQAHYRKFARRAIEAYQRNQVVT
jgi:hypothetical protein